MHWVGRPREREPTPVGGSVDRRAAHARWISIVVGVCGCTATPSTARYEHPPASVFASDAAPSPDAGMALVDDVGAALGDAGDHLDDDPAKEPAQDAGSLEDTSSPLDEALAQQLRVNQLTGDPATPRGLHQTRPADDPLVRLGEVLFFSQTLSGSFESACGTCHHPDLGGSDGLSLSVGVAPEQRSLVGPGRAVDPARDLDVLADGGPNVHRNSISIFNAALHDQALFADGRVFVLDGVLAPGGIGQAIRTPETGNGQDASDAQGLLQIASKFPVVNNNEMRGYLYADLTNPHAYRAHLAARLRGEEDAVYLSEGAPKRWLALFRAGLHEPAGDAESLITFVNIQRALAAYIASQIFVDSPWNRYVSHDSDTLSVEAKQGALLFLSDVDDGGLGCAHCHSSDTFGGDDFFNVGFPQVGRGFRLADRHDKGRWLVTRKADDAFAFRVPFLLNVALTAPYGHAGTFATLEDLIRYHVNPRAGVDRFDFTLGGLTQFSDTDVEYPEADAHTREAIAQQSFDLAESLLPSRDLSEEQIEQLVAFLSALTDDCAASRKCRSAWTPDASLDPDGHLLVRDQPGSPAPTVTAETPKQYPTAIALELPPTTPLDAFAELGACDDGLATVSNANASYFIDRTGDADFGLTAPHGFSAETWLDSQPTARLDSIEPVMLAGGVSAAYLDDDCWPDLAFAGGDASGLVFYRKRVGTHGYDVADDLFFPGVRDALGTRFTGIAIGDLDGDYRRELLIGNLHQGAIPILSQTDGGQYQQVAALPMSRNTYGIAFGLLTSSGYPDIFLSHWSVAGVQGTAPAFFKNDGGVSLVPYDDEAHTSSAYLNQTYNLSPAFIDLNDDGRQDLLVASDFGTSVVLENVNDVKFGNATESSVITDENGMGSAIGDFDGDGRLDWFVTSVFDPSGDAAGNWGVSGNRLYRNVSSRGAVKFEDVTAVAGVEDGGWGWGACAADFDNDGFLDIFHVNGFGYIPANALPAEDAGTKARYDDLTEASFQHVPPRLFINDGDGTFTERSSSWKIGVPSEGRGVVCFDHDRDGDIDIALVDHSTGLQFFENQTGHASGHGFLSVRVVGTPPNTDALGAVVTVIADVDSDPDLESQVRVAAANSNFNGQNPPDLHFGLGQAPLITTLVVRWLNDPNVLICNDVATNQFITFDQHDKRCP